MKRQGGGEKEGNSLAKFPCPLSESDGSPGQSVAAFSIPEVIWGVRACVCARARACVCTLKSRQPRASSGVRIAQLCVDVDTLSRESVQLGGRAAARTETLSPPSVPRSMGARGASGCRPNPAEGARRSSGVRALRSPRPGGRRPPSRPRARGLAGGAPSPGAARAGPRLGPNCWGLPQSERPHVTPLQPQMVFPLEVGAESAADSGTRPARGPREVRGPATQPCGPRRPGKTGGGVCGGPWGPDRATLHLCHCWGRRAPSLKDRW